MSITFFFFSFRKSSRRRRGKTYKLYKFENKDQHFRGENSGNREGLPTKHYITSYYNILHVFYLMPLEGSPFQIITELMSFGTKFTLHPYDGEYAEIDIA